MSSPSWTVAIGADEAGFDYKKIIKADLEKDPRVKSVIDVGVNEGSDKTAYPHVGVAAARKVAEGKADRAIIICGTGMGVAISACKVPGIRVSHFHQSLVYIGMGVLMTRLRSHTTRSLSRGWFFLTMVKSSR
jgi:ribose 5-phosphate isomerase B